MVQNDVSVGGVSLVASCVSRECILDVFRNECKKTVMKSPFARLA
jgi:hypothetical protein